MGLVVGCAALPDLSSRPALPTVHQIAAGETLVHIAEKYYGDRLGWMDIARANPEHDPSTLRIGDELIIPRREN